MRSMLKTATATAAFLMVAGAAIAQGDWYAHRSDRYRGDEWRARMFSEIREDLDHVQSATFPVGRDQYRLVRTKEELNELQSDLAAHRFTPSKVDDVINTMRRVVADNRMSPRDRDILNEDLQRLREYREHHERWGQH